ncbi:hypothetical protein FisN_22Lu001, partial [Fistulifera solaris]
KCSANQFTSEFTVVEFCTLKRVIVKVLKKKGEFNEEKHTVGTHTLRKTGFLFAVHGVLTMYNVSGRRSTNMPLLQPMDDDAICCAARHDKSTKTHALDGKYDDNIEVLADDYVENELKVNVDKVKNITFLQLVLVAMKSKQDNSDKTCKERFTEIANERNISKETQDELWHVMQEDRDNFRMYFAGAVEGSKTESNDTSKSDRGSLLDELMEPPKKKAKGRNYGIVSYETQRKVLAALSEPGDRKRTFEVGVEFATLSITSKGADAVDARSSSWVSKLRTCVKGWNNCIEGKCKKNKGGQEGFFKMKGNLAYTKYTCKCGNE